MVELKNIFVYDSETKSGIDIDYIEDKNGKKKVLAIDRIQEGDIYV